MPDRTKEHNDLLDKLEANDITDKEIYRLRDIQKEEMASIGLVIETFGKEA